MITVVVSSQPECKKEKFCGPEVAKLMVLG